jgi:hypothetical protein
MANSSEANVRAGPTRGGEPFSQLDSRGMPPLRPHE